MSTEGPQGRPVVGCGPTDDAVTLTDFCHGLLASWRPSLSFALASVAVLIWTVIGTTALAGGGTAVLAPLVVLRSAGDGVSVDVVSIAIRACSDLAFPLAVLVLWPAARRFPVLVFAWAAYGIGLGQGLLLAESGDRLHDGNFLWSPRLATFGVMAASARGVKVRGPPGQRSRGLTMTIACSASAMALPLFPTRSGLVSRRGVPLEASMSRSSVGEHASATSLRWPGRGTGCWPRPPSNSPGAALTPSSARPPAATAKEGPIP